jgi:hypothetical protein
MHVRPCEVEKSSGFHGDQYIEDTRLAGSSGCMLNTPPPPSLPREKGAQSRQTGNGHFFGVHSIMRVKLAQAGGGGGVHGHRLSLSLHLPLQTKLKNMKWRKFGSFFIFTQDRHSDWTTTFWS